MVTYGLIGTDDANNMFPQNIFPNASGEIIAKKTNITIDFINNSCVLSQITQIEIPNNSNIESINVQLT